MTNRFPFQDADPSWYRKVLDTLARDYPEISETVWRTTISENAAKLNAERKARESADAES